MDALELALFHFEQRDTERALEVINEFLKEATDKERFQGALLLFEFGFLNDAKEILEELMLKNPNNSHYKSLLADIFIEMRNDDEAIQLLHDITPEDDNYVESLIQLADLYQAQGLYEVAEQKLFEAKELKPNEVIIDLAIAEFLFSIGDFSRCVIFYERLLEEDEVIGDISIISRLAESFAAIGKYEKAFEYFDQLEDNQPDLLFKHGLTAFHLERYDVSIQKWKELLQVDPFYYSVYFYLGKAYFLDNRLDEAESIVQKGLNYDEHNDELYFLAAKIMKEKGDIKSSLKFLETALEINPANQEYILFNITLLKENNDFHKIINLLEDALKEDSYDPLLAWELARTYYEIDELEKALPYYEEIFKDFEDDPIFLKEFGYFLIELGNFQKGKIILKEYLQYEPLDEFTIEYLQRL